MTFDSIEEFVKKYESISIYGAGELGKFLLEVLLDQKIRVETFIISDDQPLDNPILWDIPVVKFSHWQQSDRSLKRGVLVAVSALYQPSVIETLDGHGVHDYLLVECDSLHESMRRIHPVKPEEFLATMHPVSREFGIERGLPLDRVYIERFLREAARDFLDVENILEVGSDTYSRKFFHDSANRIRYDILRHEKGMDLTDTATLLPERYDVFICTQVFNFIYDVRAAIRGAYYLLKPGGVLLATVQGCVGQVSRTDMKLYGDYWRFTDLGIGKLIGDVFGDAQVKVYPYGNVLAATAFVQGLALEDLADASLLDPVESEYAINIGVIATKRKML